MGEITPTGTPVLEITPAGTPVGEITPDVCP